MNTIANMKIHDELLKLREQETQLTSKVLDKLQVMESHRLYLQMGFSSLFDYLVRGLRYSESMAYQRQSCLRLSKEIPEIKEKLDQGALTHSNISLAYKVIKNKNPQQKRQVLRSIENKSFREAKKILAPEAPAIKVKKREYKDKVLLKLELTHDENKKLEQLKALKSHKHNLETLLLDLIDKELGRYNNKSSYKQAAQASSSQIKSNAFSKFSQKNTHKSCSNTSKKSAHNSPSKPSQKGTHNSCSNPSQKSIHNSCYKPPSPNPRYISVKLRNHLLKKANYKCEHSGCEETHFLQIDHILPVRSGGQAKLDNLQVLCGAHNRMKG